MVAVKVTVFGGTVPAVEDTLLPDQAATISENTWLYSGALVGLPLPKRLRIADLTSVGKSFRIPETYLNAKSFTNSVWIDFPDPLTDVVRSPIFGDTHDRYYWARNNAPPAFNTRGRIEAGSTPYLLGINRPEDINVVVTGGSGTLSSRSYVVTHVNFFGEESAPSDPKLITGHVNGTWTVTLPTADAQDIGDNSNRRLTHSRIYRTVTSTKGVATYFLVTQLPIATTNYIDNKTDKQAARGTQLASAGWTPPPTDLDGLILMGNGILAGWRGNEIWFSEPYRPHAWPAQYVTTVEFPIIGMGVINQTLVVCTSGHPVLAFGSNPSSIATTKLGANEPCISRGSIVSAPEGVYYASPNGLILVRGGNAENITRELITKDKWELIVAGRKFRSARFGTGYYGMLATTNGRAPATTGIFIDPLNQRIGLNTLQSDVPVYGVYNDPWSGEVFIIRDDGVYYIDSSPNNALEVFQWRSKRFQTTKPYNLGAMRIFFETLPSTPALNPSRNTALVQTVGVDRWGVVRVFADDRHVVTRELRKSGELWRIPSGFKANFWQFEIEARVKIISLQVAASVRELSVI